MQKFYTSTAKLKLVVPSDQASILSKLLHKSTEICSQIMSRAYPVVRQIVKRETVIEEILQEKKSASKQKLDLTEIEDRLKLAKNQLALAKHHALKQIPSQLTLNAGLPSGIRSGVMEHTSSMMKSYLGGIHADPNKRYPKSFKNPTCHYVRTSVVDGFVLLRNHRTGDYQVYLNIFRSEDKTEPTFFLDHDMVGAERVITKKTSKDYGKTTVLNLPRSTKVGKFFDLDYSHRFHVQQFFEAGGIPKSAILVQEGSEFFICISFQFPIKEAHSLRQLKNYAGMDRGRLNTLAIGVIRPDLSRLGFKIFDGKDFVEKQTARLEAKKKRQSLGFRVRGDVTLNIAEAHINDVVAKAVPFLTQFDALPVWENLTGLSNGTHQKREKGTRRNGRTHVLNKVQYGKTKDRVTYKLNRFGYDDRFGEVFAAYTSQTCSHCGYCDKENRSTSNREEFKCLRCGHTENADVNAAFNIAAKQVFFDEKRVENRITKGMWGDFQAWYEGKLHRLNVLQEIG